MERNGCYTQRGYKQRTAKHFTEKNGLIDKKVLCLFSDDTGSVYFGTEGGVTVKDENGNFSSFALPPVNHIFKDEAYGIFAASDNELYLINDGEALLHTAFESEITGIAKFEGDIFLTTPEKLYRLEDGTFVRFLGADMPLSGLACGSGKIITYSSRSLNVFTGKRPHWRCIFPEHSTMPDFKINCAAFDEATGFIYLGTDNGAYIYDNRSNWFGPSEISALPCEEIFDIAFTKDKAIVFATEAGLVVLKNGKQKHLPATRWVLEEKVNAVVASSDGFWAATDSGASFISEKEMTLREKADFLFDVTEKYFVRKPGFVTRLDGVIDGDFSTGTPTITDNDGLWTEVYLGSLCYAYAVTGDKKLLEAARRCKDAMFFLMNITGIKGFTARAVRFPGEKGYGENINSTKEGAEWRRSPDGVTDWLGETSSDEMTGHFFGLSLYYDFCADDAEKAEICEALCNIVDHIIENNYRLCDIDGKPTTWACWDPDELNRNNIWLWEKCVNSLEILTFLTVAYHMSGNEKYHDEFLRLGIREHYLLNVAQHKKDDGKVTHIDDNLAFLCTATILRIEKDPSVRSYIYMGLRHHWEYERPERCVLWNLMYGAFTDDVCDIDTAVGALRDLPIDYTCYRMLNSKRKDLVFDTVQEKWGGDKQLLIPLDVDERGLSNYDTSPYTVNSGHEGRAQSPSSYLLPYWFGRYYGMIEE